MNLKQNLLPGEVAEIALVYKTKVRAEDRLQVRNACQMAHIFRNVWSEDLIELLEESKILYLNRANKVLGVFPLSTGGASGTIIDIRLVLIAALRLHASNICICHNHPSGNLQPSQADLLVTEKIRKGAACLNLNLLDHIILTRNGYYSMAEQGTF
ncbi:JAB domain-containing protein [Niabella terrae]